MNKTYEKEIDIKDLIFFILHKWRSIILFSLILFILLGGYKYVTLLMAQQNEEYIIELKEKYEKDLKEYKTTKDGYERAIDTLINNIRYEEEYKKESVLFNMDPNSKWVATVNVFVQMIQEDYDDSRFISVDPADSVVKAYMSAIDNGSLLGQLPQKMNIDTPYISELLDVESDYEGNMLCISITYKDENGAKEILNTILDGLNEKYSEVYNGLGAHNIVIMNQNLDMVVDQELAESQKKRMDDLDMMRQNMEETQELLDDLQEPQLPVDLSASGMLKTGIKYSILGGTLGGGIVVFFYIILFCMGQKLYSAEELKNRYNLKILGVFIKKRRKRKLSIVDAFLDKLEGKEDISEDIIYQRIIANITNYTNKGQSVLLTGTIHEEELERIMGKLKRMIPDIMFETGLDMNKDPDTLTKIIKVDGIVLIEKREMSKYNDIEKELETIYDLNKEVIGCIIL